MVRHAQDVVVAAEEDVLGVLDAQQRVAETVILHVLAVMVVLVVAEPVLGGVLKVVRADAEKVLVLKLVGLDVKEAVKLTAQAIAQLDV